jgi:hypothetical protein
MRSNRRAWIQESNSYHVLLCSADIRLWWRTLEVGGWRVEEEDVVKKKFNAKETYA